MADEPLPADRIVRGEARFDLDSLPERSFGDYFAKLDNTLPSWRQTQGVWLPNEISRSCPPAVRVLRAQWGNLSPR